MLSNPVRIFFVRMLKVEYSLSMKSWMFLRIRLEQRNGRLYSGSSISLSASAISSLSLVLVLPVIPVSLGIGSSAGEGGD